MTSISVSSALAPSAPVPHACGLDDTFAVPARLIQAHWRDGHVLLRGVADPAEVARYRPAIRGAAQRYDAAVPFRPPANLWDHDDRVRAFVLSRRFAGVAAQLLGVSRLRLLHEQALFEEAGDGVAPWHQDQTYWPIITEKCVTMWMPLVDLPDDVGSMTFVSGSHRTAGVRTLARRTVRYGAMRAGDTTWHAGRTVHRAPSNPYVRQREVLTIVYVEDGARVAAIAADPLRYGWMTEWYPGLRAGDLWAHSRSPLVYPVAAGAAGHGTATTQ